MWIWYVSRSNGGSIASIAKQAHAYGVDTVFIKSSDGSSEWSQFTPQLVSALHARGLNVCAWQFVYGSHPKAEATLGADAAAEGADCLAIDAESQYEGRYASASIYMKRLRNLAGRHFPIALASFPYVDYHPGLPYSVFLGPGGAQKNAPQVYWHAIGTSPGAALGHTFEFNRVYKRAIVPLGQTYGGPPLKEVRAFRRWFSQARRAACKRRSPALPWARVSCSRAATAPRASPSPARTTSAPTISAISCASFSRCRWCSPMPPPCRW